MLRLFLDLSTLISSDSVFSHVRSQPFLPITNMVLLWFALQSPTNHPCFHSLRCTLCTCHRRSTAAFCLVQGMSRWTKHRTLTPVCYIFKSNIISQHTHTNLTKSESKLIHAKTKPTIAMQRIKKGDWPTTEVLLGRSTVVPRACMWSVNILWQILKLHWDWITRKSQPCDDCYSSE